MEAREPSEAVPPRPLRARTRVEELPDGLELHRRMGPWALVLFLGFWLTGWTAGCAAMAWKLVTAFEWFFLLFAVPFFASWVFVFGLVLAMLIGRERLRLDGEGISFERNFPRKRRRAPLADVREATVERQVGRRGSISYFLEVRTSGLPIHFGAGGDEDEPAWLAALINQRLKVLAPRQPPEKSRVMDASVVGIAAPDDSGGGLLGEPSGEKTRLRISTDLDDLVISRRGRWSFAALGGTTFIALFWNSIVGIFIIQLFKQFQWFLCVFLVPFEAIGLLLVAFWLSVVFAPWIGWTWTFNRSEIVRRRDVLGLRFTRRFDVTCIDRVERREDGGERPSSRLSEDQGRFRLAFVDRENAEVAVMDDLTEVEADRVSSLLAKEHPQWFRAGSTSVSLGGPRRG